ncbi:MAG: hypothetical protein RLZZ545_153 [Actinomycetota bacterium]|jgi:hypothetical protein
MALDHLQVGKIFGLNRYGKNLEISGIDLQNATFQFRICS